MPRPHWSVLEKLVAVEPDWEPLRRAVTEALHAEIQGSVPPHRREGFYARMDAMLDANTGAWYPAATGAGDETIRSWCWCHSPWQGWDQRSRSESIEFAADSIVGEVQACFAWHRAIARTIAQLDPSGGDPVALAGVVETLVERIVHLGTNDAWYRVIAPAVAWALERDGDTVTEAVEDEILEMISRSFTSWIKPSFDARRDFAQSTALELLDGKLSRRWPAEGE